MAVHNNKELIVAIISLPGRRTWLSIYQSLFYFTLFLKKKSTFIVLSIESFVFDKDFKNLDSNVVCDSRKGRRADVFNRYLNVIIKKPWNGSSVILMVILSAIVGYAVNHNGSIIDLDIVWCCCNKGVTLDINVYWLNIGKPYLLIKWNDGWPSEIESYRE